MITTAPQTYRFSRDEYYQMADLGFFEGHRVELIEGEIIDMAPQKDLHAVAVMLTQQALLKAFPNMIVRCQLPLTIAPNSEPEPDFALVPGSPRDYAHLGHHPTTASLVIEISDSTLAYDRTAKASLYASASIPEFWLLNLLDRQLEVHTNPIPDPNTPLGYRYATITPYPASASVTPLTKPTTPILVADLLP